MKILKKSNINEASEILKNDGLLAFPTETVYGLGIKATSKANYEKLVKVKNRPNDKPFTLMCASINDFKELVEINEVTKRIIKKFMPGPLTLILKTKNKVPDFIDLKTGFVGVRIPDDEFVLSLIKKVGAPLLVPSANISSFPPAMNHNEVINYFHNTIDGVIEGECDKNSIPSAIFKIDGNNIIEIRKGKIKLEEIMEAIEK